MLYYEFFVVNLKGVKMLKKITKWETEDGTVFDTQEEAEEYMFEQEGIDRRWLSDSFNRGAQTLEEATASARAMVVGMDEAASLLSTPKQKTKFLKLLGKEYVTKFVKDVLEIFYMIAYMLIAAGLSLIGALTVIGSLFFDVTLSQLTLTILATHFGLFVVGLLATALGVKMIASKLS